MVLRRASRSAAGAAALVLWAGGLCGGRARARVRGQHLGPRVPQREEPTAEVARIVPIGRLLVETDAPYLSPPGAPRRNEPRWVEVTARWVAERRGMDPEVLAIGWWRRSIGTFGPPG
ncbi:MAG: TatD family hydrolase [Chloroflexota bacterium]